MVRAMLMATAFLTGAAAMPDADGQDVQPKEPEKPKAPFTVFVKWERIKDGKPVYTAEAVSALPHNGKWVLKARDVRDGKPAKGDRITGPDGKVYAVTAAMNDTVSPGSIGAFRLTVNPPVTP